ncbi:cyclin-P-like [Ambystoma mexicanum]|uniref:cyclin-P-like n=1 Tax=Ambystoma mexicanum TaxID=8296 RepID=UPI0037E8692B
MTVIRKGYFPHILHHFHPRNVQQLTSQNVTVSKGKQATCSLKISDVPRRITARMRAILVDWLVQVHEYFTMEEETLYLAIYLMNLFLKASNTQIPMLQLLGATCLFLACKLEEDSYPEPDLLCSLIGKHL